MAKAKTSLADRIKALQARQQKVDEAARLKKAIADNKAALQKLKAKK